jgi:hypothetical protein
MPRTPPIAVRFRPDVLARVDEAVAVRRNTDPKLTRNAWIVAAVEEALGRSGPTPAQRAEHRPEPEQAPGSQTEYVAHGCRVGSRWMWTVPGGWPGATAPMSGPVPYKGDVAAAATDAIARQLGHRNFTLKVQWP